eukprot:GHVL01004097.1.p1 GENE.GHVL01004097.1~~GHVL01004097.1.p1  ORF type:complete len:629 (+),score=77.09 GHVL01004097.1:1200-3086(+)
MIPHLIQNRHRAHACVHWHHPCANTEFVRSRSLKDFDDTSLFNELRAYVTKFLETDINEFWHRKSKKIVLAVLMVVIDDKPHFFRGMNSEISLPSGSNCAERAAICNAISNALTISRKDMKAIAVIDPMDQNNPIWPCGVCSEWLKKIQEESDNFTIFAFSGTDFKSIHQKYQLTVKDGTVQLPSVITDTSSCWCCAAENCLHEMCCESCNEMFYNQDQLDMRLDVLRTLLRLQREQDEYRFNYRILPDRDRKANNSTCDEIIVNNKLGLRPMNDNVSTYGDVTPVSSHSFTSASSPPLDCASTREGAEESAAMSTFLLPPHPESVVKQNARSENCDDENNDDIERSEFNRWKTQSSINSVAGASTTAGGATPDLTPSRCNSRCSFHIGVDILPASPSRKSSNVRDARKIEDPNISTEESYNSEESNPTPDEKTDDNDSSQHFTGGIDIDMIMSLSSNSYATKTVVKKALKDLLDLQFIKESCVMSQFTYPLESSLDLHDQPRCCCHIKSKCQVNAADESPPVFRISGVCEECFGVNLCTINTGTPSTTSSIVQPIFNGSLPTNRFGQLSTKCTEGSTAPEIADNYECLNKCSPAATSSCCNNTGYKHFYSITERGKNLLKTIGDVVD